MTVIPLVYFSFMTIYFFHRYRSWNLVSALFSILIVFSFFSLLVDVNNLYGEWGNNENYLSFFGVILYCFLWTVVILPFMKFCGKDFVITINKPQLFNYLCYFLLFCSFVYAVFSFDINSIITNLMSDGADMYQENSEAAHSNYRAKGKMQILLWIPLVINKGWPLLLLLFFINLLYSNKTLASLFLILSLLNVIVALSGGGRAMVIYWIFFFYVYFSFFYNMLSLKLKKQIIVFVSFFIVIIVSLFLSITLSRFDNGNSFDSIIGYAGQTLNNFCAFIYNSDLVNTNIQRIFPFYSLLLGKGSFSHVHYYDFLNQRYSIEVNNFSTLFGEIALDLGCFGLMVWLIGYLLTFRLIKINGSSIDVSSLFLFVVLLMVPILGFFAYPYVFHFTTAFLLFSFLCYFMFRFNFR